MQDDTNSSSRIEAGISTAWLRSGRLLQYGLPILAMAGALYHAAQNGWTRAALVEAAVIAAVAFVSFGLITVYLRAYASSGLGVVLDPDARTITFKHLKTPRRFLAMRALEEFTVSFDEVRFAHLVFVPRGASYIRVGTERGVVHVPESIENFYDLLDFLQTLGDGRPSPWWATWKLYAVLLPACLVLGIGLAILVIPKGPPPIPQRLGPQYNADEWKSGVDRFQMAGALIRRGALEGKSREGVLALLGDPDLDNQSELRYILDRTKREPFPRPTNWLAVRFDPNNIVREVEIVYD